jgi:alkylated DNA repair dioxygenase AlkB
MDLFEHTPLDLVNLLPFDGEVYYYGKVIDAARAEHYFQRLLEGIAWKHDEAIIFGKRVETKRKVAWYGDKPFSYTYSKITKQALPWTPELLEIKALVEQKTGTTYNSCLLNLYHTGEEGMA